THAPCRSPNGLIGALPGPVCVTKPGYRSCRPLGNRSNGDAPIHLRWDGSEGKKAERATDRKRRNWRLRPSPNRRKGAGMKGRADTKRRQTGGWVVVGRSVANGAIG